MKRCAIVLGIAGTMAGGLWMMGPGPSVAAQSPRCEIDGVDRIVAVGDVHGAYDRFVEVLRIAGIVDDRLRWSGGRTHLVQTGDLIDRGPDSRKVLDLMERLQGDARRAGGTVHALLGNHEVMRMLGDMRYVTAGEYQAFVTGRSERVRESFIDSLDRDIREQVLKETPLGFVEMRLAFGRNGQYGEWLRKLDAVVKINGIVFVHGGISPETAGSSCEPLNRAIRRELTEDIEKTRLSPLESVSGGEHGPLWYRGLAQETEVAEADVEELLAKQQARAIVIGHTLAPERRIRHRFGGKVFQIDTGMQPAYVEDGRASALEIQGGVFTAVYAEGREVLFTETPAAAKPAALRLPAAPRDLRPRTLAREVPALPSPQANGSPAAGR